MTEKNKTILIVVLSALAVFLGVFTVYKHKTNDTGNVISKQANTINVIDKNEFSDDEIKLLHPPLPGSSQQDVDEHAKLAGKLSTPGDTVEINSCKSKPIVLVNSINNKFLVKNIGDKDLSISFDGKNNIQIKKGNSVDVKQQLVHGKGLYGYICETEGFKGLVGFIIVAP